MTGLGSAASLSAARRARELEELAARPDVDLLVIGGGITGAGVALDAASRGLRVVLAERRDLAFGTSRWSSKLVHGGLRYLAHGQVGVAYESAVERDILLRHTAPHLVRALPMVLPVLPGVTVGQYAVARAGLAAGDLLRIGARTPATTLPRARRIGPTETRHLAPGIRTTGLRGALLGWDGVLDDDAHLVVTVARTAAAYGARILTRVTAESLFGHGGMLRDELTGARFPVRAAAVINATGVWAGQLVNGIALRPSRGSHLLLPAAALGDLRVGLTISVPGESSRFVLAVPHGDGRICVGPTDVPSDRSFPDVVEPTEAEIGWLLDTLNSALQTPVRGDQVIGSFAGLRPLLDSGDGRTADLSRRHAVLVSDTGVVTVVGGKLTTYRRMAQDAVDTAVSRAGLDAGPCRTHRLPLVGAGGTDGAAPAGIVARYGDEAAQVVAEAGGDPALLQPIGPGIATTMAELLFAVRHEGALDVDDLLDRRTRVGLVAAYRDQATRPAREALARSGVPVTAGSMPR
jgi:glycerol-3-phosphate dehydrogenase